MPAPDARRLMPLYYFNIYNDDITLDDEGVELADDHAAQARGIKEARVLAADTVRQGHFTAHHRLEVVDEHQKLVAAIRFDEAVELR